MRQPSGAFSNGNVLANDPSLPPSKAVTHFRALKANQNKAVQQTVARSISQKREQIAKLREELEDLDDYLDLIAARVRDEGNPRIIHVEVKKGYGLK